MPITERTPNACFDVFVRHVSVLFKKLLSGECHVYCPRPPRTKPQGRRTLSFRGGIDDAIPLKTAEHGTVYFFIAQELVAIPAQGGGFRLRTEKYWYRLFGRAPGLDDHDAIVRWEYARTAREHSTPCRHHVQFGRMVRTEGFDFDFARLHVPTGWVLLEEVCRFLVCDLGVKPPCGDTWPSVLADAESKFYETFTSKGGSGY